MTFKYRCSKCGGYRQEKDYYCRDCRNNYNRKWMQENPRIETEKKKAFCRSYAWEYLKRDKISKFDCEICHSKDVQMHHRDLSKPLKITWLCKKCFKSSFTANYFSKQGEARI